MLFNFKDNEKAGSYVVSLGAGLQTYDLPDILVAPYLNEKFDKKLINKTIN